jgi:hypothetical protein
MPGALRAWVCARRLPVGHNLNIARAPPPRTVWQTCGTGGAVGPRRTLARAGTVAATPAAASRRACVPAACVGRSACRRQGDGSPCTVVCGGARRRGMHAECDRLVSSSTHPPWPLAPPARERGRYTSGAERGDASSCFHLARLHHDGLAGWCLPARPCARQRARVSICVCAQMCAQA